MGSETSSEDSILESEPEENFETTPCSSCAELLAGASQAPTLRQHIRSARIYNKPQDFYCEEPGCGAMFRRSDNRLKHHKDCHPWFGGRTLAPATKQDRRKTSGPEQESEIDS